MLRIYSNPDRNSQKRTVCTGDKLIGFLTPSRINKLRIKLPTTNSKTSIFYGFFINQIDFDKKTTTNKQKRLLKLVQMSQTNP